MGKLVSKEPCPKCREEGRDSRGDNLYIYEDGRAWCHAGHGAIYKEVEPVTTHKVSIADCLENPIGSDPARGLAGAITSTYAPRVAYDTTSGTLKRVYYPYRNDSGVVTGVKVRIKDKKDFFVVGELEQPFGAHLTSKHPKNPLLIVEGEEDAMAAKQILSCTPLQEMDVVSIPFGATATGVVQDKLKACISFFQKYRQIVIMLDNDPPGQATAKGLASWLVGFIDKIKIVKVPCGCKDASDFLMGKKDPKEFLDAIKNTPAYCPEGIIRGEDILISDIIRAAPKGYSTPYEGINSKLKGIRKGEILTVCAASGIGKSTLVTEIGYDLVVRHNLKVCHIALENIVQATAASYIAMDNNIPTPVFREHPDSIPIASIGDSMDKTVRKMYFFDHFGSVESKSFISKLLYYARSGVDFIILDHLSMVISGSDVQNERKEIDKLMTDLASMVVSTGVGLINVVHLKRRESGGKDKGLNEGGQVSLTDLRGSAALEQLSWAVLALERNQQADDGSEDYSYLRILKNRTWGKLGKAGRVRYDHKTGRLIDAPEEIENAEPIPLSIPEEIVEKSSSEELEEIIASLGTASG